MNGSQNNFTIESALYGKIVSNVNPKNKLFGKTVNKIYPQYDQQ